MKVRKMEGNESNVICGLTSSSTSLYWEGEREEKRRLGRPDTSGNGHRQTRTSLNTEHLNEFPSSSRRHPWKTPRVRIDSDVWVRVCAK